MGDILRISGLRKRFGDKEVLRGLDLTVPVRHFINDTANQLIEFIISQ